MPELPEVETVRLALELAVVGSRISKIATYTPRLRSPLSLEGVTDLLNSPVSEIKRRAKYLILNLDNKAGIIIHLGMTGSFRLEDSEMPRLKHDHIEFYLSSGKILRYNDPRRFGQVISISKTQKAENHPLLNKLGPEPLSRNFTALYLIEKSANKSVAIKKLIMDGHIIVGVGNIYASEALFMAGIHPAQKSGDLSHDQSERLVKAIKKVLKAAIKAGGTTIRDYSSLNGEEGYFAQKLSVYGKEGKQCARCKKVNITKIVQAGRSTFFCPLCQEA